MQPVIMPKLGLTMEEGTIIRWLKNEGDPVERGEVLFEVETDKSVNEVDSLTTGTLGKRLYSDGDTVEVLTVIGYILEPGEVAPEPWPEPEILGREVAIKTRADKPVSVRATPIAKKIAAERGVNLADVQGTGERGTITKQDVLNLAESEFKPSETIKKRTLASPRAKKLAREKGIPIDDVTGTGPGGRITEDDVHSFIQNQDENILQPTRIQQITAERMVKSFTSVPHFYLRVEVIAEKLVGWREKLIPVIEKEAGVQLTITDLLILFASRVLVHHPRANATWVDGSIHLKKEINLGLATSTEGGLVVPVIRNVDNLSLSEIALERKRLTEKAAQGKLGIADMEGSTFTLTNLGMFGIDDFDAIINPPESAVLAVGRIADRVVGINKMASVKPTLRLSLSVDHRVLDGALAARFLGELKEAIESPDDIISNSH